MGARPTLCLEASRRIPFAFSKQPLGVCSGFLHMTVWGGKRRGSRLDIGCGIMTMAMATLHVCLQASKKIGR